MKLHPRFLLVAADRKGLRVYIFMYKKHEPWLFSKQGKAQLWKQVSVAMDILIQAKAEGIGFPEIDLCKEIKRGSLERKENIVSYSGIYCIHQLPPYL